MDPQQSTDGINDVVFDVSENIWEDITVAERLSVTLSLTKTIQKI